MAPTATDFYDSKLAFRRAADDEPKAPPPLLARLPPLLAANPH
ncbi:MAG TPA: hypothetical protein VGS22_28790 [Thermoanaerobaculia bacterium]|nr:hypothetical protein [Thermoanaerobaculia bacterium]